MKFNKLDKSLVKIKIFYSSYFVRVISPKVICSQYANLIALNHNCKCYAILFIINLIIT